MNPATAPNLSVNKDAQHQQWDSVAEGWKRWLKIYEQPAQKLSERLIAMAGIKSGSVVLDIATGIGEPAVTVAKTVGKKGYVIGIDISSRMISIARERAASLGLLNLEFKEADIERLDSIVHLSPIFDSAVCRWGLMSLSNLEGGLTNIYNLLKTGGRFATAVMSEPERVPFISVPMKIIRDHLDLSQQQTISTGVFSLSNPKLLQKLFGKIGLRDLQTERFDVELSFVSPQIYVAFVKDVITSIRILLDGQERHVLEKITEEIIGYVQENYTDSHGTITMHNESLCMVGTK